MTRFFYSKVIAGSTLVASAAGSGALLFSRHRELEARRAAIAADCADLNAQLQAQAAAAAAAAATHTAALRLEEDKVAALRALWEERDRRYAAEVDTDVALADLLPEVLEVIDGLAAHYTYATRELPKYGHFDMLASKVHAFGAMLAASRGGASCGGQNLVVDAAAASAAAGGQPVSPRFVVPQLRFLLDTVPVVSASCSALSPPALPDSMVAQIGETARNVWSSGSSGSEVAATAASKAATMAASEELKRVAAPVSPDDLAKDFAEVAEIFTTSRRRLSAATDAVRDRADAHIRTATADRRRRAAQVERHRAQAAAEAAARGGGSPATTGPPKAALAVRGLFFGLAERAAGALRLATREEIIEREARTALRELEARHSFVLRDEIDVRHAVRHCDELAAAAEEDTQRYWAAFTAARQKQLESQPGAAAAEASHATAGSGDPAREAAQPLQTAASVVGWSLDEDVAVALRALDVWAAAATRFLEDRLALRALTAQQRVLAYSLLEIDQDRGAEVRAAAPARPSTRL